MLERRRWLPAEQFADPGAVVGTGILGRPTRDWGAAPHTAAALAFKAYSWRLVNPVVLGLASGGPLPRLDLANVEVALRDYRPYVDFRVRDHTPLPGTDAVPLLRRTLVDGHVRPVIEALAVATRIGRRTLWGSVAEAVASPLLQRHRRALAEDLLDALGLAGLVRVVDDDFAVRRTCCQAITLPDLGICASCPVQRCLTATAVAG